MSIAKSAAKSLLTNTSLSSALRHTAMATTGFLMATSAAHALNGNALPTGGSVESGGATFSNPASNQLNINQSTQNVVINWTSFNIGTDATTRFIQPNTASIAVNRVNDVNPSQILGNLQANGHVVVLNTNGVVFGANAKVDVSGLLVSTGTLADNDFSNGQVKLTNINLNDATIKNNGTITIANAGLAAFVAPNVVNNGVIEANLGRIALAAGADTATVDMYGDGLVELALDANASKGVINNYGTLRANGGKIAITVKAAQGVVDSIINMKGVAEANSVGVKDGVITLGGENVNVKLSGKVNTTGGKGKVSVKTNRKVTLIAGSKTDVGTGDLVIAQDGILDAAANTLFASGDGTISLTQNASGRIQEALDAMNSTVAKSKTILVGDGKYNENLTISQANVTLTSVNGRDSTTLGGVQSGSEQGTVYITNGTNNVQVGAIDHGFTIKGLNGNGASEKAAVYIQGANSGTSIIGNDVVARGDAGLMTEYSAVVNNLTISDNIFSGKTFEGITPSGFGSSTQFDLGNNVPRQLVVIGGGNGGGNTTNVTFTNNDLTGTTGGTSLLFGFFPVPQGNFLATIDAKGATITGNTFEGKTTLNGLFRARGTDTLVSGNTFEGAGVGQYADYLLVNGSIFGATSNADMADLFNANTFNGNAVYATTSNSFTQQTVTKTIQKSVYNAATGATVVANAGTYNEDVSLYKALTLQGANAGISAFNGLRGAETIVNATNTGFRVTADNVTVDGFKITSGVDGVALSTAANAVVTNNVVTGGVRGIASNDGNGISITNNAISNTSGDGIVVNKNMGDVGIFFNRITDAGDEGIEVHGSELKGSGSVAIRDNTILNAGDDGIQLDYITGNAVMSGFEVANNTVDNSDSDNIEIRRSLNGSIYSNLLTGASKGIRLDSNADMNVYFNEISNTSQDGIHVANNSGSVSGLNLISNIVTNAGYKGIDVGGNYNTNDNTFYNVYGNTVSNSGSIGILVANGRFAGPVDVTIDSNTVTGGNGNGIALADSGNSQIANNILVNTGGNGISVDNVLDAQVSNNIIDNAGNNGIELRNVSVANLNSNTVLNNLYNGIFTTGPNGKITLENNNVASFNNGNGATFQSGEIDLTGGTNTFTGGTNGLIFDQSSLNMAFPIFLLIPGFPFFTYDDLSLTNNTFGTTALSGQTGDYIRLINGALFNPGTPTDLDANSVNFNGYTPNLNTISQTDLDALNNRNHDFTDNDNVGRLFFTVTLTPNPNGAADINDILPQQQLVGGAGDVGGTVTILGLPYASLARATSPANLADIAPAAGGNGDPAAFSPEALNDIDSAAGNGQQAGCWAQVYNSIGSTAVTYSLNNAPMSQLNDQASCTGTGA